MTGSGADASIRVESLRKDFGRFTAVDDVSFQVSRGEIFGYLGANGAGKSTTIKMLCGLMRPSAGNAWVDGFAVDRAARAVRARIGYMSQKFSLYLDLPVRANLEFFAGAYGIEQPRGRISELAERLELAGLYEHRTQDLPGGLRQKVALCCALLHDPSVVFLDEPTAGVDPVSRREFWALIQELAASGTTVFVTTHYLDEAEGCDRVGLMVDGKLVALDSPAGLKATFVPGTMFRVLSDESDRMQRILQTGEVDVETFGRALHVRFSATESDPEGRIRKVDPAARIRAIQPSLEDVFLQVVRTYGRGE